MSSTGPGLLGNLFAAMRRGSTSRRAAAQPVATQADAVEPRTLLSNTLAGRVLADDNGDDVIDAGDDPQFFVRVVAHEVGADNTPFTSDDAIAGVAATDAFGNYRFDDLPDGTYAVRVDEDRFTAFSAKDGGMDDAVDSDVDAAGRSDPATLGGGATATVDALGMLDLRRIERISEALLEDDADDVSEHSAVSANGRFVVFASAAGNLVDGDTPATPDVFIHDRGTGQTVRALLTLNDATDEPVRVYSVTDDGMKIAFTVENASNDLTAYVYDAATRTTTRVDTHQNGTVGNGESDTPSMTPDGRYVAFTSTSDNLTGDDLSGQQVYRKDLQTGVVTIVSRTAGGGGGNGSSAKPSISADGQLIAYQSVASDLVAQDNNAKTDIFVHNAGVLTTMRVSVDAMGADADDMSSEPSLSPDGRFVAYQSDATNLVAGDTNGVQDIFVRDLTTAATERVSVDGTGVQGDGNSLLPSVSGDGMFVTFESAAGNLVLGDTNGRNDVFVRDVVNGTTLRVSRNFAGGDLNGNSYAPTISRNGQSIVFHSGASNLVAGDGNGRRDIFHLANPASPNAAPTIIPATFGVAENSPAGTSVGSVQAADTDGDNLAFAITGGTGMGVFDINATTGELTLLSSPDHEAATSYTLEVTVTDDGTPAAADTATFVVNVTDVNEAPVVTGGSASVPEDAAVGTPVLGVTASDPDTDGVIFRITGGNAGGSFAIDPVAGVIAVAGPLDHAAKAAYTLTVEASDGSLSDTATVRITVTDVNEPPTLGDATVSVDENSAVGAAVTTLAGSDPDAGAVLTYAITSGNGDGRFALNPATGEVTVAGPLDHEALDQYVLGVVVSDGSASDSATLTINVADVNEAPDLTGGSASVAEDAAAGTPVLTVAASDPDGDPVTFQITGGNAGGAFAIDPASGVIIVVGPLDHAARPNYSLTVTGTDGLRSGTATVEVAVSDVDYPPTLGDASAAVDEDAAAGTPVTTLLGDDPDAGASLTYAITSGNAGGAFAIDPATGAVTVAGPLDHETAARHVLGVSVSDGSATDHATLTVDVNDVNEAPAAAGDSVAVFDDDPAGTVVARVSAADPDRGQRLRYAITAGNDGSFRIGPHTGVITVSPFSRLDHTAVAAYELTVTVTDDGSPAAAADATVAVEVLGRPAAVASTASDVYHDRLLRVSWGVDSPGGRRGGSPTAGYDVYVSVDGGPQTLWMSDTAATRGDYPVEPGRVYAFEAVATDEAGHTEGRTGVGEATVRTFRGVPGLLTFDAVGGQWFSADVTGGILSHPKAVADTPGAWSDTRTGDFDGDGRTDVALRDAATGVWSVALMTDSGRLTAARPWADQPATGLTTAVVGDFNGDGRDDLAWRGVLTGRWTVAASDGTSFTPRKWGEWNPRAGWGGAVVGDFDGDLRDDLVSLSDTGEVRVALVRGRGFSSWRWASLDASAGWHDLQGGDIDGGGRDDISVRRGDTGGVYGGLSRGGAFALRRMTGLASHVHWEDLRLVDVSGDGRADVVARHGGTAVRPVGTGKWFVALSTTPRGGVGTASTAAKVADWVNDREWLDAVFMDADGDGLAEPVGRLADSGAVYTSSLAGEDAGLDGRLGGLAIDAYGGGGLFASNR